MDKKLKDYFYIDFMGRKKKGQYRCRVQLNGKRWNKYFDTKEEAEAYKLEVLSKKKKIYRKGDYEYFSLKTLFDELVEFKSHKYAPSTLLNYRHSFKIFNELFDDWFHLLSREDCESILKNSGYGTHKSFNAFNVLNQINEYSKDKYNYSLDWSLSSLRKEIKLIRGQNKKPREYHTKEEIKKISEFLFNHDCSIFKNTVYWYHVYCLGLFLGCRVGELCSLKKKNFNKETKSLLIDSTITKDEKENFIDSKITKTKTSRICQLSDNAIESIEWLIEHSKTKYILGKYSYKIKNDYLDRRIVADNFRPILKHLGIVWIGTHGMFRKTFATQLANLSNKSHRDMIASIQKQLGHKSPQMTLHYIQAIDTDLTDELSKMDDLI